MIDPGEPPEGMVLAIIKDGMTPRVPGPKQLQRLEGGEITRQQLLESLAGKDKDGWEVGSFEEHRIYLNFGTIHPSWG